MRLPKKRYTKREYEKALKIVATEMMHDAIRLYREYNKDENEEDEEDNLEGILEWYHNVCDRNNDVPRVVEELYFTVEGFTGAIP